MKTINNFIATAILILCIATDASATIWRINNNAGVNAGFTSAAAAVSSTSVLNGDTLYFEASPNDYGGIVLSKRLVIIGTGYLLDNANNPGLQANTNAARLANVGIDSAGSGSVLLGIQIVNDIYSPNDHAFSADNITISRCAFDRINPYYNQVGGLTADGWNINKCYFGHISYMQVAQKNWKIQNCLAMDYIDLGNTDDSGNIVRNNVIRGALHVYNGYVANNIIAHNDLNFLNSIVKNNLGIGTLSNFTSYAGTFGNQQGFTDAQMFISTGSLDGKWTLATGSPATGAGLTVGSVTTPDCGAYGGPDPYILSGIPPIPTIYSLTVPASIPSGTPSMNVTFSTRSNH